jgi:hypothetical protein
MLKLFRISALAALALGATALTAQAQRAKQVGLVAGVDFTDFSGCTYDGTNTCFISEGTTTKTGFVGGLFVGIPVGGGNTWIEPELLYISKGAKYDNVDFTGTETLDYISVPILFRWNSQPDGGFFFLIGPTVNFNISCSDSGTDNETGDSYDDKCSDVDGLTANTTIGGMVGIGFSKGRLGIEGRWMNDWGQALAYKDPTTGVEPDLDIRNTGWTIMARFTK